MKKFLTTILLLWSVLTLSAQSLVMKVTLTDGTSKEFAVSEIQEIDFTQEPYVDLGLESGLKWATMNVGATSDTDPGTPYKWDEAESVIKNQWTKQHGDREWRMPTKEEIEELVAACDWSEYKNAEGKAVGYKVAKKGNENLFIILPFANYWSATAYDSEIAWYLRSDATHIDIKRQEKVESLMIRPVWGKPLITATIEAGTPDVSYTSATIPVKVSSDSDIEVGSYGIRYSTQSDMSNAKTVNGSGTLKVNTASYVALNDLSPNTKYYYQAFAELRTPAMSLQTEPVASFTTRSKELSVSAEVSYKTATSATLDLSFTGNVVDKVYYKVLYGQDQNLVEDAEGTISTKWLSFDLKKTDTPWVESVDLESLEPGKTYYYRVFAKYSDYEIDPVNGNFVTDSQTLSVSASATDVGATSAQINMTLASNMDCEVSYYVEYGVDENLSNPSETTPRSTTLKANEENTVNVELSGLTEGNKYYYRAVAKVGTLVKKSGIMSLNTTSKVLTVSLSANYASATTAQATLIFKGNVTGSGNYKLLYGEGQNLNQNITGSFTINRTDVSLSKNEFISNLKPNQSYSVQLVAGYDNAYNVSSEVVTFKTPAKALSIYSLGVTNIKTTAATIQMTLEGNTYEKVSYEVVYSKNEDMSDPLTKSGIVQLTSLIGQTFNVGLDQLEDETTYYYKVSVKYATDTEFAASKSGYFTTAEKVTYVAPEKVDLGCSVLWGSFNLGAKNEKSRGAFFGWGDPTGEKVSQYESYGDAVVTPPVDLTAVDSLKKLDIVHVNLGDKWHTPTSAQMLELVNNCTWTYYTDYNNSGINGYEVRGKGEYASNFIFIPSSGYRAGVDNDGNILMSANTNESYYWSSELTNDPWGYGVFVKLQKGTVKAEKTLTFYGMHIRPVYGEGSGTPDTPGTPDPGDEDHSLEVAKTNEDGTIVPVDGVDLGLTVKWASWNVGATETITENNKVMGAVGQYGGYYSWGETSTKPSYSYADYTLNLTERTLTPEHDAASVNWGDDWRMPTEDEWDELVLSCSVKWETVTWTTADGAEHYAQGYRYTSKVPGYTDRSIFLPAGGADSGSGPYGVNQYGYYWSSSKHLTLPNDAVCLLFSSDGQYNDPSSRYERFGGLLIRPVKPIAKKE